MPIITCSFLANQRAGNALFIYSFCRAYSEAMGCELQTPPWIGQKIFQNVNDPPITVSLPKTIPDHLHPDKLGYFFGQKYIDICTYAQHQKFIDFYTRAKVKEWFKLKPECELAAGMPYSAAHLRRGDYLQPPFNNLYAAIEDKSYDRAIEKYGIPLPIYYVSESTSVPGKDPIDRIAPWLRDFVFMRNATHLLRANSSFSWWAATLGNGKVYSPVVGSKVGWQDVEFVEGNWPCTAGIFKNQSNLHLKES